MDTNDHNLNPPIPAVTEPRRRTILGRFLANIAGDRQFAEYSLWAYERVHVHYPENEVNLIELNFHIALLRMVAVSIVSKFEGFLEDVCRKAFVNKRTLLRQFDLSVSIRVVGDHSSLDGLWDTLVDRVLRDNLHSGRLSTYSKILNGIGAPLPDIKSDEGRPLNELFERRNIIIHNNGVPDEKYKAFHPNPITYPSGGLIIDLDYIKSASKILHTASLNVVRRLVERDIFDDAELDDEAEMVQHFR